VSDLAGYRTAKFEMVQRSVKLCSAGYAVERSQVPHLSRLDLVEVYSVLIRSAESAGPIDIDQCCTERSVVERYSSSCNHECGTFIWYIVNCPGPVHPSDGAA
jgi:hypothetical protein